VAFPAVIDTDTAPFECFPVIQHRRVQPQIICILSHAAPSDAGVIASGTRVQFLATALAIGLVVSYSCFVPLGEKSKSTKLHLSRAVVRLSIRIRIYSRLRLVCRPAAMRSSRRRDTIVSPRPEKLHRGNNRYDSCRELFLVVFLHSASAMLSFIFFSFLFSSFALVSLSFSIRSARGARSFVTETYTLVNRMEEL